MRSLPRPYPQHTAWRLLEAAVRLLEWMQLPALLLWLNRHAKPNTRPLTAREIALARSIFGENIDYQKVRMDEQAVVGCRKYRFAYVGFQVINCWGRLSDRHFIHEMVHIWQYQRFGAVYIPRALWAQRTAMGYNYGGIETLRKAADVGQGLLAFNWEQQGDIVADYFCLKNGMEPRWCEADVFYLPFFEKMVKSLEV